MCSCLPVALTGEIGFPVATAYMSGSNISALGENPTHVHLFPFDPSSIVVLLLRCCPYSVYMYIVECHNVTHLHVVEA